MEHLARTRKHEEDSKFTLLMIVVPPIGGTRRTIELCQRLSTSYLLPDVTAPPIDNAKEKLPTTSGRPQSDAQMRVDPTLAESIGDSHVRSRSYSSCYAVLLSKSSGSPLQRTR